MKSLESITIAINSVLAYNRESFFSYIWDRYRKKLYYYITAVMHCSHEDGEDLLQEIMLKVYNTLDQYRTGHSFNAWIYTIARNHCLDFKRRVNARPCGEEFKDCDGESEDPFEAVCSGELNRAIRECLEKMEDIDGEIAYLRHFERLRYKAIGELTGMNMNSVKTRVRAVEARLREDLKEWL